MFGGKRFFRYFCTDMEVALYLLPVPIADVEPAATLPAATITTALGLRRFIVENVRTARRFLRRYSREFPIDDCEFFELNEHTNSSLLPMFLAPLRAGIPMGLMSEAGCPAVADPGAQIVALAQKEGIRVVPMVGPSSILLALMASGFNGQGFSFVGYLPVKPDERGQKIRQLDALARRRQTQIFIETPYRNNQLLAQLARTLSPDTLLCVASDITGPDESILTMPARCWARHELKKVPTIFLICAQNG